MPRASARAFSCRDRGPWGRRCGSFGLLGLEGGGWLLRMGRIGLLSVGGRVLGTGMGGGDGVRGGVGVGVGGGDVVVVGGRPVVVAVMKVAGVCRGSGAR
jgi:hypothetical protein